MYDRLQTNAVTWKTVTGADETKAGVTRPTAERMLKYFFDVLDQQARTSFAGDDDLFGHLARKFHTVYAADILAGNYDKFIERVGPRLAT
jgi:hypothetical protein